MFTFRYSFCFFVAVAAIFCTSLSPALAEDAGVSSNRPVGVILVVIDDIGYGDIDALSPSDLETPNLDQLYRESIRLTDFHVATTCSPTRGSLMTGRYVNAGGVWHTIAGREILRESEQTMAEVFQFNGWRTGIFGKWHLGEGYPFSPRFRGFDVSVIHGGGGVGQGPDAWKNDYYSGVDFDGNPTRPDTYFENGVPFEAQQFCTDVWFQRAKEFVRQSVSDDRPFFCYLPTNAAHGPFHAPHGFKKGFDGLIENVDTNMGQLDRFLEELQIKDDVLLVFTTDNGTTGKRLGGLRDRKGSHYDGGHNVPCFWRWKNGGIAGETTAARDINSLTAVMDFLPTFASMLNLSRPEHPHPWHGIDLTPMLTDENFLPRARSLVVDTQRGRDLIQWKRTCIMHDEVVDGEITHKWRLTKNSKESPFELYDFLVDRETKNDLTTEGFALLPELVETYIAWWDEIVVGSETYPAFTIDDRFEDEITLFAHSWIGQDASPWNQSHVVNAGKGSRKQSIRFARTGKYRFELRRWPREDGGAICSSGTLVQGVAINVEKASIEIEGVGASTRLIEPDDLEAVFEFDVDSTEPTTITTAFLDSQNEVLAGAYYVYVRKIAN